MINLEKMLDYDIDYFKGSAAFQIAEKYFEIKRYNLAGKEYRKCFEYFYPVGRRTNRTDAVLKNKEWTEQGDKKVIQAFRERRVEIDSVVKIIEDRYRQMIQENVGEAVLGLAELLEGLAWRKLNDLSKDEDLELVTETNEEIDTKVLCLLEQAATLNSKEALHRLGYIYENKGDYKKAKDYYAKAVALGCGDSAFSIADVIEKEFISNRGDTYKGSISWLADMSWGNLVLNEKEKEMLKEAVNWLLIAASLGNSTAMSIISNCYKFGVGVEKNEQLAKHWSSIGEICVGVVKRAQDELLIKY